MNPFPFFAVVAVAIVLGLIEAAFDGRAAKRKARAPQPAEPADAQA